MQESPKSDGEVTVQAVHQNLQAAPTSGAKTAARRALAHGDDDAPHSASAATPENTSSSRDPANAAWATEGDGNRGVRGGPVAVASALGGGDVVTGGLMGSGNRDQSEGGGASGSGGRSSPAVIAREAGSDLGAVAGVEEGVRDPTLAQIAVRLTDGTFLRCLANPVFSKVCTPGSDQPCERCMPFSDKNNGESILVIVRCSCPFFPPLCVSLV